MMADGRASDTVALRGGGVGLRVAAKRASADRHGGGAGRGRRALTLSAGDLGRFAEALRSLEALSAQGGANQLPLVKLCGVAMIAEFASDICRDAGEAALARRIEMGVRLGVAAAALPLAAQIMERIAGLLS